ncbi:MAG: 50S ribosomal protein L6, partial [Calditrichaeota bacterium]|nr:50S ribosomal protein L6 [Calditrichota bacterium]
MSRIGKYPVSIPAGLTVTKTGTEIVMKSNKGSLTFNHRPEINVEYKDNEITVKRSDDTRQSLELHGLTRT